MKTKLTILITIITCLIYSCKKEDQAIVNQDFEISQEVIAGISYKCITVGEQLWMAENLKTRLNKGRAEGCMTFNEEIVTLEGKESVEMKLVVKTKLLKELNDGFFNISNDMYKDVEYFINDDLVPYFFNRNIFSWAQYQSMNGDRTWTWYYEPAAVELVRKEITRLFEEEKNLLLLAAADQNYIKEHGYLYTFEASQKVIPQGWRIPTDEDWMKLEKAMGMDENDIQKIDQWRGKIGNVLKANPNTGNFNATLGGAYIYGMSEFSDNFKNKDIRGYWWTSTKDLTNTTDSIYFIRGLRIDNDQVLRGTTKKDAAYSIRLVRDK